MYRKKHLNPLHVALPSTSSLLAPLCSLPRPRLLRRRMLQLLPFLRQLLPLQLLRHLATAVILFPGQRDSRTNHALQELHANLLTGLVEANGCILQQRVVIDEMVEGVAVHVGHELMLAGVCASGADVACLEEGKLARVAEFVGHDDS